MRTLRAPGIEVHEFDCSYSAETITDIPAVFAMGFANKGTDCDPMYVYSLNDFVNTFGTPVNEAERFFYNAAKEVFSNGGLFVGAKLPYENEMLSTFKYVEYTVDSNISVIDNTILNNVKNVKNYRNITLNTDTNDSLSAITIKKMTFDEFDSYKTNSGNVSQNKLLIVDISKKRYTKDLLINNVLKNNEDNFYFDNECIGLVPVIVSPINAMYFQNIIETRKFNSISNNFVFAKEDGSDFNCEIENPSDREIKCDPREDFYVNLVGEDSTDVSVSQMAASYFPGIIFRNADTLSAEYLKHIGIVVFMMVREASNNGKISFIPLESYIGTLGKTDIDEITGASTYICNIINNSSRYINVFANITDTNSDNFNTYMIKDQLVTSIGFKHNEAEAKISIEEMEKAVNLIIKKLEDKNQVNLRVFLDAGISNIAQYIENKKNINVSPAEYKPETDDTEFTPRLYTWRKIIEAYKYLCESMRKDCMFIADGPRNLCLTGNVPVVRNRTKNVKKNILPNIKFLKGFETSYGAGYLNWFYCYDNLRSEFMWLPPSVKIGGILTRLMVNDEFWKAPAGITNARLYSTYDVAFNPTNEEAGVLYDNNWNYAVSYPEYGIVPEGQKTFQKTKTAFDRINVRMLFLGLEHAVYKLSRSYLYDMLNDELVSRFESEVIEIMNNYKLSGAVLDFKVICDNSNNTTDTIENHELHCVIGVKPPKSLEWIILNFVCTSQDANVEEIVSQYTKY